MEITAIKLSHLRNEEHFKIQLDFEKLLQKFNPLSGRSSNPLEIAYRELVANEEITLDVIRRSNLTDELSDLDVQRDACFRGLADTVSAASKHFSEDVRTAASRLQIVFDTFGNVAQKPYGEETAAIIKLVANLQGAYAADCAIIGVTGWVAELQTLNNTFDTTKASLYNESATSLFCK